MLVCLAWFVLACSEKGEIDPDQLGKMEYFDVEKDYSSSLVWARALVEDKDGDIWVGTSNGVSKISAKRVSLELEDPLFFTHTAYRDSDDNLWFGTIDGPIVYRQGEWLRIFAQASFVETWSILQDRNGEMWFGTSCCGTLVLGEIDDTELRDQYFDDACEDCNYVYALEEDAEGNIWIGSKAHLQKFDGEKFTTYDSDDGLPNEPIRKILSTSWGELWVGTEAGLYKMSGNRFYHVPLLDDFGSDVRALEEDAHTNRVFLSIFVRGLLEYDGLRMRGRPIMPADAEFGWYNINDVMVDSKGAVWLAVDDGVAKIN